MEGDARTMLLWVLLATAVACAAAWGCKQCLYRDDIKRRRGRVISRPGDTASPGQGPQPEHSTINASNQGLPTSNPNVYSAHPSVPTYTPHSHPTHPTHQTVIPYTTSYPANPVAINNLSACPNNLYPNPVPIVNPTGYHITPGAPYNPPFNPGNPGETPYNPTAPAGPYPHVVPPPLSCECAPNTGRHPAATY
ncbi:nematocyst expressed protein 4-like isoform X1 [Pectinophora gossypiella]|uniref:nematocyst expressed protein 4-like isoform X1 n=1 Tax=Pectinophora gossypiella TaxID=13191 RepID=UPI00214E2AD1|nr:nematocyst expressed protein 4-like isoform X1 [Pectinophora gossypiella]